MKQGKIVNLNIFKGMEREYNRMSVACTSDGRVLLAATMELSLWLLCLPKV